MPIQRAVWAALLLAVGALAACSPGPARTNNGQGGAVSFGGGDAIRWPLDASHTLFQIDVTGGPDEFAARNDIPLCAIYGDNRIVYLDNSQPGRSIVLFDVLEDVTIYNFVTDLTVNKRLFTYEGRADLQFSAEERPFYERILLDVNNTPHTSDGFSDWPPGYFRDILESCTSLTRTPALFEPSGGWLSAQIVDREPSAANIYWNEDGAGIDLVALADSDERLWIDTPQTVRIIWNVMTNSPRNRQFSQGDDVFELAFEVPNVHPSSPPAPAPDELDRARTLPSDREE